MGASKDFQIEHWRMTFLYFFVILPNKFSLQYQQKQNEVFLKISLKLYLWSCDHSRKAYTLLCESIRSSEISIFPTKTLKLRSRRRNCKSRLWCQCSCRSQCRRYSGCFGIWNGSGISHRRVNRLKICYWVLCFSLKEFISNSNFIIK